MARSTTQPAPGEATATGDAMEKANRDGNSGDPLPTYSTWVFRDGEFVPIQPRSPSPPPPPLSSARREFDERIRAAHEERAQNSAAEVPRLTRSTINVQLQWRIQKLQEEQSNQLWRKPYKLFAPWPLEMRMRCANYVDLLDEYYKHEETTRRMVEYQLAHYGDPENQWQINEEELEEIAHLTKLQKTLEEDKKADNDFKVLSKVLEDKEGEINQRTGSAPGHLVSDLPEHVMQLIERDPRLQKRLEDARATECECFPFRDETLKRKLISPFVYKAREKRRSVCISLVYSPSPNSESLFYRKENQLTVE